MDRKLTLFYAPHSRAGAARMLLEELGLPYRLEALDLKRNETRSPSYLRHNPMGKVPAVLDGEVLVAEQAAIMTWLADLVPAAGLAPALEDPLRGPYLRWMAFHGNCFEPALVDRALKREPASASMSPYGDFDTMYATLAAQLRGGPWLLGERHSAADILWGYALGWATGFELVPKLTEVMDYVARCAARPAAQRVVAWDAELAAEQDKRRATC